GESTCPRSSTTFATKPPRPVSPAGRGERTRGGLLFGRRRRGAEIVLPGGGLLQPLQEILLGGVYVDPADHAVMAPAAQLGAGDLPDHGRVLGLVGIRVVAAAIAPAAHLAVLVADDPAVGVLERLAVVVDRLEPHRDQLARPRVLLDAHVGR